MFCQQIIKISVDPISCSQHTCNGSVCQGLAIRPRTSRKEGGKQIVPVKLFQMPENNTSPSRGLSMENIARVVNVRKRIRTERTRNVKLIIRLHRFFESTVQAREQGGSVRWTPELVNDMYCFTLRRRAAWCWCWWSWSSSSSPYRRKLFCFSALTTLCRGWTSPRTWLYERFTSPLHIQTRQRHFLIYAPGIISISSYQTPSLRFGATNYIKPSNPTTQQCH